MVSLLLTVALSSLGTSAAFGISDIKIVGQPGGVPHTLPAQYVRTFARWSVNDGAARSKDDDLNIERIPSEGDDTFVNPTSTSELWWPSDINNLQVRPCLDVLMQGGAPNYALAGLNVRVPGQTAADGAVWRNYGLNSQPLARQWTTFALAVESGFRVECFVGKTAEDEVEEAKSEEKGEGVDPESDADATILWDRFYPGNLGALDDRPSAHAMFASEQTNEALEKVGVFLSGIDDASPLASGFHVVSFPLTENWTDLPKLDGDDAGYKLLCVATAEPDAESLIDLDEGLVDMTATSILRVDVSQTSPGSESEYLPDSYRPLYVANE